MRGSVYYQTSLLAKAVFSEGTKKEDRINPDYVSYGKVASFKTMETYRRIWNNFGLYLRDEFNVKDFELVTSEHIESYMLQKIDISPSQQYMEKISSALGKLEHAIRLFRHSVGKIYREYDFSIRQTILDKLRKEASVYDGYHNRVYDVPADIISLMEDEKHKLAAKMQLQSGARFEGVGLISKKQRIKKEIDPVTKQQVYMLETKEKGGKVGFISLTPELYEELQSYLEKEDVFKVDYQVYARDIRNSCKKLGVRPEGTHGFRWSFAQRRIREYQEYGSSYLQALQGVSIEMKHNRITISEHYLG